MPFFAALVKKKKKRITHNLEKGNLKIPHFVLVKRMTLSVRNNLTQPNNKPVIL